jgi:hypothetical protein
LIAPFIKGGAKWCTGPKTKRCYSYQLVDDTWVHAIDLIKARVYAGTTTMPGGTLWIMGGVGVKSVLRSSEIVQFKKEKWTVRKGPKLPEAMMGHCLTALGPFFLQNLLTLLTLIMCPESS